MRRVYIRCTFLLILPLFLMAQSAPVSERTFAVPSSGSLSLVSSGSGSSIGIGYATLESVNSLAGMAIFGFRQGGVLVSETAAPASGASTSSRFYARLGNNVNTGIAAANTGPTTASISYSLTDTAGANVRSGTFTVAARAQVAAFLDQSPFDAPAPFEGTFSFTSSAPIAVTALRGLTNERGEFLMTTLPLVDNSLSSTGGAYFPHFADGGGWTTQVLLVNPGDTMMAGTVLFSGPSGTPTPITVNGRTNNPFPYSIPPRSAFRLQTSGEGSTISAGTVQVLAADAATPASSVVFSYKQNGVTVTETGASSQGSAAGFFLYAEAIGNFQNPAELPIQTGIAISNLARAPATITVALTSLDGTRAGAGSFVMQYPDEQQKSLFLTQIPGLERLQLPFHGMMHVTSSTSAISVMGLRGRYNERGDFLLSTTPTLADGGRTGPASGGAVFPHFADGGGYTTQFVLFSGQYIMPNGQPGSSVTGTMRFRGQTGASVNLSLLGGTNAAPPVLSTTIVDIAGAFDAATSQLGTLNCTYKFPTDPNDRWCFIPFGAQSPPGKVSPALNYKVVAGTTVRAVTSGTVVEIEADQNQQFYPGEYEIRTRQSEGSPYLVIYDHVRELTVSIGAVVNPGDRLGIVGIHTSDPARWGRTELQVVFYANFPDRRRPDSICPVSLGVTAFRDAHQAALAAHNAANPAFPFNSPCLVERISAP